ncbi:cob(I)yrinic acid a,c-diamide adenosyltransferase [Immundisolibacter cernigliae]|uniref:Corrinoid adenosyltransferase n=1 Tax=Immundisolibacter cernigliae TaxID=1810504 RepID=A0A1B1YX15_9GAMM|nr:cob(I)yrinic acid a,c-diamide adenosyltransferase [Immundisolibacter cernigliae]ANX05227.1 cob(I)yrinic acid a,c-diamide adenosyltransferase [Immundisolibacter cernigliae]
MTEDRAERHRARMARRKARVDADIAAAAQDKGLLLVLTGPGKGKSSSAFGMLARALGHGHKVSVVQFIKGRSDTGEEAFFRRQPGVDWQVCGAGFTWETQDREQDIAAARAGWAAAACALADPTVNLVVLDELTYLFSYGYLDLATVLADLAARPPMQHVVVTGRAAPQALIDAADTVSDIGDLKHAFRAGVRAQPGIDW